MAKAKQRHHLLQVELLVVVGAADMDARRGEDVVVLADRPRGEESHQSVGQEVQPQARNQAES